MLKPRALPSSSLLGLDAGTAVAGWLRTPIELTLVVCYALLVRLPAVMRVDFPLNDGGLFLRMVQELQSNGYILPAATHYNELDIPFAYPPLGFYLTGLVATASGMPLIDVFRFLPVVVAVACVVAFYALARTMLPHRLTAFAATLAYAVVPPSYLWLIMGGGITRAVGSFFSLLALRQAYLLFTAPHRRHIILLVLWFSLTTVSHLESLVLVGYSMMLFAFVFRRTLGAVASLVVVGGASIVITVPWWGTVLAYHGLAPFLAVPGSGDPWSVRLVQLLSLQVSGESFPVIGSLALLGVIACVGTKRLLLPGWLLLAFLLPTRAADQRAVVPLAMLAAIGLVDVVIPLVAPVAKRQLAALPKPSQHPQATVTLIIIGLLALLSSFTAAWPLHQSLTLGERSTMQWIARSTPPDSRFLVVTGEFWAMDRTAEWFPVLANRVSVATVQGTEWLTRTGFTYALERHEALQKCATVHIECVEQWAQTYDADFTHLYVNKRPRRPNPAAAPCCQAVLLTLRDSPRYQLIFDSPEAAVYAARP